MTGHILNHVDIPTWLHDRACPAVQGSKEQKSAARKTAIQQLVFGELAGNRPLLRFERLSFFFSVCDDEPGSTPL
jgi:hypothetical protein